MEQCANTHYLNKYMEKQEQDERDYELMLDELRNAEPDDYQSIMDSYGFGDADLVEIMKDL